MITPRATPLQRCTAQTFALPYGAGACESILGSAIAGPASVLGAIEISRIQEQVSQDAKRAAYQTADLRQQGDEHVTVHLPGLVKV